MTTSPTSAERAALKVAQAAAMTPDGSYDLVSSIVFALGSAQLLMDPETAAEMEHLRKDRDAFRDQRNAAFKTNTELLERVNELQLKRVQVGNEHRTLMRELVALRARVAELETERHTTNAALLDVTVALREAEAQAPLQVVPVVDDVPVPAVLTERAEAELLDGGERP